MLLHSSNSTSQARNILGALETGYKSSLKQQLMLFRKSEPAGRNTFESERIELLSEIARELEHASNPFRGGAASVYHGLLKHLANVRPVSIESSRRIKTSTAAVSGFQSARGAMPVQ
jgi:hypothetical protein